MFGGVMTYTLYATQARIPLGIQVHNDKALYVIAKRLLNEHLENIYVVDDRTDGGYITLEAWFKQNNFWG